ncbi:MAG: WD40-repeat-containing domain protein [Benjaminiella poitrasii]|nr:MAG: WD40-repeat-containing domain protein [Benjaminiella poitrasii]
MAKKIYEQKSRTVSTFAWYPGHHHKPMMVTGTLPSVDTFRNASEIEILELDRHSSPSSITATSHKLNMKSRFHTLAWGHNETDEKPYGIIAGGLETGELELLNPAFIIPNNTTSKETPILMKHAAHSGTIQALDFNRFQTHLLASAGNHSEVFIWDLNQPTAKPYTPGARSVKMDDISSVAWNSQVQHIIATSSINGYTVIWDLRNKKEVMTLANYNQYKNSISSIAWHPNIATQIVTAADDEQDPIISLWDLRQAQQAEKTFRKHTKGVVDLAWCVQDSDLLVSTGKDGQTLGWNPNTGHFLGQLSNQSVFKTQWCPQQPDLIATSSQDSLIHIFSIDEQGYSNDTTTLDKNRLKPFTLERPPKWLRRPTGASFGFGGKIVMFGHSRRTDARHRVTVHTMDTDLDMAQRAEQLEAALTSSDESLVLIKSLIEDRVHRSQDENDREDWRMLQVLYADNPREELVKYLGFDKLSVRREAVSLVDKINCLKVDTSELSLDKSVAALDIGTVLNNKPVVFDRGMFSHLGPLKNNNVLFDSATEKSTSRAERPEASLFPKLTTIAGDPDEMDQRITRAVILGDFASAVDLCLAAQNYSDALLLAMCGGPELMRRTQIAYFEQRRTRPTTFGHLLKGLLSIEDEDTFLSSIIAEASVADWPSVVALLCTYAPVKQMSPLCDTFSQRLQPYTEYRRPILLLYLIAGNFEKVTKSWIARFNDDKKQETTQSSSTAQRGLQVLIEKISVFRKAVDYKDYDLTSLISDESSFTLSALYRTYSDYSELMAMQGKTEIALKYLQMIPVQFTVPSTTLASSKNHILATDRFYGHPNLAIKPILLQNPHVVPARPRDVDDSQLDPFYHRIMAETVHDKPSSTMTTRTAYYSAYQY